MAPKVNTLKSDKHLPKSARHFSALYIIPTTSGKQMSVPIPSHVVGTAHPFFKDSPNGPNVVINVEEANFDVISNKNPFECLFISFDKVYRVMTMGQAR